ncbi:putative secreted protein [Corynebacterium diphtheriae 31A]|nr:putative secreted protein [Corynebacterium diphtheriae 31A]
MVFMRHHLSPLFIAVSCLSVMITGCTIGDVDGETTSRTTLRQSSPTLAQQPPAPASVPDSNATGLPSDLAAALESIVTDTQNELGGAVGIAIAGPEGVLTAGTQAGVPAWSTIKVPISIAALRANPGNDVLMRQAITVSDNDAARALWDSLGSPREKWGLS